MNREMNLSGLGGGLEDLDAAKSFRFPQADR